MPDPQLIDLGSDVDDNGNFVVDKTDEESFSRFEAQDYLANYYPEIDTQRALNLLARIKELPDGTINIDDFINEGSENRSEALENMVIFDFQRRVTLELMKEFPEDHIETLDVGSGPTIYQHIGIALDSKRIISSEYLEQNREEVLKWLEGSEDAYNWDSYFHLVQKYFLADEEFQQCINTQLASPDQAVSAHAREVVEALQGTIEDFKDFIKKRLSSSDVVACDVFQENLGLADGGVQYESVMSMGRGVDLMTSNFSIESATGDRTKWLNGMNNVMAKVKTGGFLSMTAIRNANWYKVGDEEMPAVSVNEDDLQDVLTENGFDIVYLRVLTGSRKEIDGYDGMVFILAKKITSRKPEINII